MQRTRAASTYQLHVELGAFSSLQELAEGIARHALEALPQALQEQYLDAAVAGVEEVLRQHIVGYDTCGMASICRDSEPFDPWSGSVDGLAS